MTVRLERLVELIHDARRWNEGTRDYMPELGCSKCGKGCMPLCGLGLNRKVTPLEHKDVVLKTRKMMIETGRRVSPVTVQIVTGSAIVIMYEKALDCVDEIPGATPGEAPRIVFTAPIPTMCGLLCKDCKLCQICGAPTEDKVHADGVLVSLCLGCTEHCADCGHGRIRHHSCCTPSAGRC